MIIMIAEVTKKAQHIVEAINPRLEENAPGPQQNKVLGSHVSLI